MCEGRASLRLNIGTQGSHRVNLTRLERRVTTYDGPHHKIHRDTPIWQNLSSPKKQTIFFIFPLFSLEFNANLPLINQKKQQKKEKGGKKYAQASRLRIVKGKTLSEESS